MEITKKMFSRKVSMSDLVSSRQSRATKRVVRRAALDSIKDQDEMAERAKTSVSGS